MSGRTRLIVGNWKMNLGPRDAAALAASLCEFSGALKRSEAWIAPPFVSLAAVAEKTKGSALRLGAQNVHWKSQGAYTGEISTGMLQELGCTFALAGHSERRQHFFEDNELV